MRIPPQIDEALLEAALEGLEMRRERLDAQIAEIRAALGNTRSGQPQELTPGKRNLSAAARKRMSEAQKRRWAAVAAEKDGAAKADEAKAGRRAPKAGSAKGRAKAEDGIESPAES